MKCRYCGTETYDNEYCPKCGAKVNSNFDCNETSIVERCSNCGGRIDGKSNRCVYCGTLLTSNNVFKTTEANKHTFDHNIHPRHGEENEINDPKNRNEIGYNPFKVRVKKEKDTIDIKVGVALFIIIAIVAFIVIIINFML